MIEGLDDKFFFLLKFQDPLECLMHRAIFQLSILLLLHVSWNYAHRIMIIELYSQTHSLSLIKMLFQDYQLSEDYQLS